jgi:RNA polymerase sigma-70 factor (ECF subfamily)
MEAPARVPEPSDLEIVTSVLGGERALFEVLVRRHNQRLYRAARAITRADADAEDVLQQTWLKIFRNLRQFRGDASFATWATRIAIHEAISFARKRPAIAEVVDSADPSPTLDDAIDHAQLGALLERCLGMILQGNREVIVLRDVLELDTAETAACLGLTEEAVRVRLHRGRAAVAATLTEQLGDVYSFDGAHCDRITTLVMREVMVSRSS